MLEVLAGAGQRFAAELGLLLDGLAVPGATVLTCTLPDIAAIMPLPAHLVEVARERMRQASDIIRKQAAERDVVCLDAWAMPGAADPGLFGVHRQPGPAGLLVKPPDQRRPRHDRCKNRMLCPTFAMTDHPGKAGRHLFASASRPYRHFETHLYTRTR